MNFLRPHPDTLLWWEQRQQCELCANCNKREVTRCTQSSHVMRCKVSKTRLPCGKSYTAYCIDARLPGQPCGPDAALFKEKT